MDRKEWLALIYREANRYLDKSNVPVESADSGNWPDLESSGIDAALHEQLVGVLITCNSLEDLVKYSILKNPPIELWRDAKDWQHALGSVAAACLVHDVKGILIKIKEGSLPRMAANDVR